MRSSSKNSWRLLWGRKYTSSRSSISRYRDCDAAKILCRWGSSYGGYHAGCASRDLGNGNVQGELQLREYRLHPLLRGFSAYGDVCRGGHLPALQERNSRNPEQAFWRLCSSGAKCPRQRRGGSLAGFYFEGIWQGERAVQLGKDDFGAETAGVSGDISVSEKLLFWGKCKCLYLSHADAIL